MYLFIINLNCLEYVHSLKLLIHIKSSDFYVNNNIADLIIWKEEDNIVNQKINDNIKKKSKNI